MKYKIARVKWLDAEEHGEVGWNNFAEIKKHAKKPCPIMHSVGFVIHYDKESHISLVSCISDDEKHSGSVEKIPIAFVLDITYLS
jgi:hypothetical protein